MRRTRPFPDRLAAAFDRLSPAERKVAGLFRDHPEEVMVASAQALAARAGTSDATVVRTARTLGYAGLEALRRDLAAEMRRSLAPAARVARTLHDTGADPTSAFAATIALQAQALQDLPREIAPRQFAAAVDRLSAARRIVVFGLGPSTAIAAYFAFQLDRFGKPAAVLSATGQALADGLHGLRRGDLLVILAYNWPSPELAALLDHADVLGVAKILLSDTLGEVLARRVDLSLRVHRGRVDRFSMHTATLGLVEALLVGIAAKRPDETMASLRQLDALRARLSDRPQSTRRRASAA